jgi:hypothetical protein
MTRRNRKILVGYAALVIPFVATLWVPLYNRVEPRLAGIPFFYWYQFAWIFAGALLTAAVYFATDIDDGAGPPR